MGNTCSSRRTEKDNASLHSEEYQLATRRKSSQDSKLHERCPALKNILQSGVVLKVGAATSSDEANECEESEAKKNASAFPPLCKDATEKPLRLNVSSNATSPERTLYLPEDINGLSNNHKELLLGIIPISKPILKAKKIVIYICAADSDECHIEKNILHGKVYPELRKICREESYELHVVDLHWWSALEKRRDHKFSELCLFELNRQSEISHIVPVIFLNNSLGLSLLPKTIDCVDYEISLQKTQNKEVLKKWYKLDKEAQPPCYVLQSIEQHISNFNEINEPEKEKAFKDWNNEVENILQILVSCFSDELRDTYLTTIVEQEIYNTMRMSQELTKHTIWLRFNSSTHDSDEDIECPVLKENRRRLGALLTELKNELPEKNIIQLKDANDEENVKNQMLPQFVSVVHSIIDDDRLKGGDKLCYFGLDKKLLQELMLQTMFCQKSAAAHSISNHYNILNILKNYMLSEDERGIMVLHGVSGCGKTTILARFLLNCQALLPNLAVVFRFLNVSVESSSLELLLHSILQQIHYVIHGRELWEPHNISKYVELFPKFLSVASENRPVLVIIDGLDQIRESVSNIDWIPVLLPRNIKFIFSITKSTSIAHEIQDKLRDTAVFVEVPTLRENEAEVVFNTMLTELDGFSPPQLPENICSTMKENSLPFHIKITAHQYSWLKNETIVIQSREKIEGQINQMLDILEKILGKAQVELILALLMAARYGLTDSELLDVLSYEDLFHSDSYQVVWAPACIFLSEFNKYMRSFLRWFYTSDSIVIYVQHELMRDALQTRYKLKLDHARQLLHTYFTGSLWDSNEKLKISARVLNQPLKYKNGYNTRKLEELPYHEYKLFNTLQKHFLEDHVWLFSKICSCSVFQVLEDVKLEAVGRHDNDANLVLVQTFLENYAPVFNYDGRQFYSQLLMFLNDHKKKVLLNTSNFITNVKTAVQKPPVFSLLSYSDCVKDRLPSIDDISYNDNERRPQPYQIDVIKRIEYVANLIVTVSLSMKDVSVWDITNGQLVRKLVNIPKPITLEMIDAFRSVILCDRELRIYNFNTGELLSILKGVMNQKMPYFGLHDSNHLVVLTRSRMYVNLMNLESGDVVTSFKAGEDRFLNSLLVSGNGKILVCGDETQKPFPLLVWNLASRKLLYDLRIAHHDFVTKLAAITYEGNYICCVAKEVDEPSPNFIVVYDLQSGTLFKKWKPGVNCLSLDISSKDSCVISGHQNGTISIWDLVTGACKWTLEGHTAPVTCLRLDALGGAFLSIDTSGRDRSIRLWNLTNGEMTAVYTSNRTIKAAEILAGGKYVVIATEGTISHTILHLTGPTSEPFCPADKDSLLAIDYGIAENYGKTFDMNAVSSVDR